MIKYGKEVQTKSFVNWDTVQSHTTYTERIAVKTQQDVLAEFVKLQNRQNTDNIYNIGIRTIEKQGVLKFIELTYMIKPQEI